MKSYVYFYDTESKDLFGVEEPMTEYDYDLATLDELIKQKWANETDEERIFVVAEGEFYYRHGKFIPV